MFLSVLLTPCVNFCENRGVSRALASVLVFAVIIFFASMGFKLLAPVVSHQVKELSSGLNDQSPAQVMQLVREKIGDNIPVLSNPSVQEEIEKKVGEILKHSFTVVADVLSAVMSTIMVAFMTFFFLKDGRRIKKALIGWVPNRYFEVALMLQRDDIRRAAIASHDGILTAMDESQLQTEWQDALEEVVPQLETFRQRLVVEHERCIITSAVTVEAVAEVLRCAFCA